MPKFFCVENSGWYKVYMNSIYKSSLTLGREVSVIWPQENIVARALTIKLRNDQDKSITYRKWNGKDYIKMSWSFTGSSIDMSLNDRNITITCPLIQVSDRSMLPFNSCSIKPSREVFQEEHDRSNYERADIYERDPNSPEYITPFPERYFTSQNVSRASPVPVPVAVPVASPVASPVAVPVASPIPVAVKKGLPPHVANIVLADAISKNEICPISSETITRENGSVTSCGHVFCKESIDRWLSTRDSKGMCPVCKQVCL